MHLATLVIRVHYVVIQNRLGYGISFHHNVSLLTQVELEQNVDFTERVCAPLFTKYIYR